MTRMTKDQLVNENIELRAALEQMRRDIAALKSTPAAPVAQRTECVRTQYDNITTSRPIVLMTLDKSYAFKAREQLARTRVTAVKQCVVRRNGESVYAYAVY